jgi:hypothetical protein
MADCVRLRKDHSLTVLTLGLAVPIYADWPSTGDLYTD